MLRRYMYCHVCPCPNLCMRSLWDPLRQISGGVGKTVRKRRNGGRAGGGAPIGADRTAPEP